LTGSPRNVSFRRALFVCCALAFGLIACATVTPPLPVAEGPVRGWEAAELIESLMQRQQQFRSIRTLARVDYAGPEGKRGFQEAVLVERPDRLRLETLSFIGTIYIVTVSEREIVGHDTREGLWVRGEGSKENLFRLTKIPLEIDEVTTLLLGLPPVPPGAPWMQEGHSLVFAMRDGSRDVVSFESEDPVPTKWERISRNGEVELRAVFTNYEVTDAGLFPVRIWLESITQKRRLDIRYDGPELNVAIPPDAFSQKKPAHVTEIPIDALGS
jgi:hypothetical protein